MIEFLAKLFYGYPALRRIIANLKTGTAFRGVLWQKRRGYLVLRNAEMLKATDIVVPVDGEVVITSENVDFLQVLNG